MNKHIKKRKWKISEIIQKIKNRIFSQKWELAETIQNLRSEVYYHTNIRCDGKVVAQSSGIGRAEAEANAKMIIAEHENQD